MSETPELEEQTLPPSHRTPETGMVDVCAKGVTYTVVSVKKPGSFILRGIKKWSTVEATRERMEKYVAIEIDDLEWTYHQYHLPHYLEYGSGDIPALHRPVDGVYIHRHIGEHPHFGSIKCTYGVGRRIEAW